MPRKLMAVLLILSLVLSLGACTDGTVDSSVTLETRPTQTTTAPPTTGTNSVYEDYYAGKPAELMVTYKDYQCQHFLRRNRQWEADVVYMARMLLENHPVLKDGYSRTQKRNGEAKWLNKNEYYDGDLRRGVIEAVDLLLAQIPDLADYEIQMEMERIVAMLSDVHTWIMTVPEAVLPVSVELMEKDGQVGLYVVRAPKEQPELLFCQLTAINGWPVEDVIDLLKPYVSAENEYGQLTGIVEERDLGSLIDNFDALCAVGVANMVNYGAVLTFLDHDGKEFTAEIGALPYFAVDNFTVQADYFSNRIGLHARQYEEYYWYEVWPEENAVYFRIVACLEMPNYSMNDCCADVLAALESAEEPMRLIIDLRHNGGGYYPLDGILELTLAIQEMELDGIYFLIDSHCFSATTYFAVEFDQRLEDAVFIGTPMGQPYSFFAGAAGFQLPQSGWQMAVSTVYSDRWPDFADTTFMPDIFCYPNWEDYVNGIDSVLNTALNMNR